MENSQHGPTDVPPLPVRCPGMKSKVLENLFPTRGTLVAVFGQSRLVRTGWNRYEIHGGSVEDREEAGEWMSLFLHGRTVYPTQEELESMNGSPEQSTPAVRR